MSHAEPTQQGQDNNQAQEPVVDTECPDLTDEQFDAIPDEVLEQVHAEVERIEEADRAARLHQMRLANIAPAPKRSRPLYPLKRRPRPPKREASPLLVPHPPEHCPGAESCVWFQLYVEEREKLAILGAELRSEIAQLRAMLPPQ
jgi:hypothetical protein